MKKFNQSTHNSMSHLRRRLSQQRMANEAQTACVDDNARNVIYDFRGQ